MTQGPPPSMLPDVDIATLLARRIDLHLLSRGMVVGVTDVTGHRFIAQGHADASTHPVDATTLFEIGSITKVFTALVLADMADKGEVRLDEPVARSAAERRSRPGA